MYGRSEDRIIVVGAHWDTVPNTGGLDDNGSGVAAMLELGILVTIILIYKAWCASMCPPPISNVLFLLCKKFPKGVVIPL